MPSADIRIEDLDESNMDDLIYVCSSTRLEDPIHRKGIELKKEWLRKMLKDYGPVAKIAYFKDRPVAQILYYPMEADPTSPRLKGVLFLHCIYNPFPEAQGRGIGTALMQTLLADARKGIVGSVGRPYNSIITHAFNTQEYLPLPEFYRKMGFKQVEVGNPENMSLRLANSAEDLRAFPQTWWLVGDYIPLPEDRGRAIIFYSPVCQFFYQIAVKAAELVKEVSPNLPIELVNLWEEPEKYIKRGRSWLIVNAKAIKAWPFKKEEFLKEVKEALSQ